MLARKVRLCAVAVLCVCPLFSQSHPKDAKGSSDHPLFPNRMPGYSISSYHPQGFASYSFKTKPPTTIEGKYTLISYYLLDTKGRRNIN